MSERAYRQRAIGAIVGSAVGDALGAPFEFGPPGQYLRRFPRPIVGGTGEMIGGGGFGWGPGEFTDDTQMAIVQAESLLACGGVDGADLFQRFQVWAGGAADVGIQTRAVLTSGQPWDEAALQYFRSHPDRSAGNGSLMRSTPTAVHFAGSSLEDTIAAARATSAVTHADPATGWGTAIHHVMVRAALDGDDPFAALAAILEKLPADQARYLEMLHPSWQPSDTPLPNGTVWTCLAQAVWAVRRNDDVAGALVDVIELGGDTDTVAAVAGGLGGAIHGIQSIPSRWTTYLHGHVTTADGPRTYRLADLHGLALRLVGASGAPDTALGPRRGPTQIAPGVYAADLAAAGDVRHDWAVVSLCRVGDRFARHPVRREVYVVDKGEDHNLDLAAIVTDTVDSIDAFLAEGRSIVVHCHGGASRTGLVVRAWLMRTHGWDEPTATSYVRDRWPDLGEWNDGFTAFLRQRWNRTP